MGLGDDIKALAQKAQPYLSGGLDERNTESVLIEPFIQALGYDIGNPSEVRRQLPAAYRGKGKKVDFAIMQEETPIILFECKKVGVLSQRKSLLASAEQLSRYFNNTPTAKFGILTDGLLYSFYTDFNAVNIMDKTPFHVLDLRQKGETSWESSIPLLDLFRKGRFNVSNIHLNIRRQRAIKAFLQRELTDPTPYGLLGLVGHRLPKDLLSGQKTKKKLNSIKPVLQQVLAELTNISPSKGGDGLPLDIRDWQTLDNWVTAYAPSLQPDAHDGNFHRFRSKELGDIAELTGAAAWGNTDQLVLFEFARNIKHSHVVVLLTVGPGDETVREKFYRLTRKRKGFLRQVNRKTAYMRVYGKTLLRLGKYEPSDSAQIELEAAKAFKNWYKTHYFPLVNAIRAEFGLPEVGRA